MKRTLYWTPRAWRISVAATLIGVFVAGMYVLQPLLGIFWWLVLLAVIGHLLLRKSLKLELGICAIHRRRRNILRGISLACLCLIVLSIPAIAGDPTFGYLLLLGSAVALLALAIAQSYVGVQAIRLQDLSEQHAWLTGTGAAFRNELPELN